MTPTPSQLREVQATNTEYHATLRECERDRAIRHQAILAAIEAGATYTQIGELLGISRQRVRRIVNNPNQT